MPLQLSSENPGRSPGVFKFIEGVPAQPTPSALLFRSKKLRPSSPTPVSSRRGFFKLYAGAYAFKCINIQSLKGVNYSFLTEGASCFKGVKTYVSVTQFHLRQQTRTNGCPCSNRSIHLLSPEDRPRALLRRRGSEVNLLSGALHDGSGTRREGRPRGPRVAIRFRGANTERRPWTSQGGGSGTDEQRRQSFAMN